MFLFYKGPGGLGGLRILNGQASLTSLLAVQGSPLEPALIVGDPSFDNPSLIGLQRPITDLPPRSVKAPFSTLLAP